MSTASDKVAAATTTIILDHPFFASLLLGMKRIEDPSVPTACTNGVVIKYNPDFIDSLTESQVAGLLVHEVLHPALGHLHRLPRTTEGNIAGDYAINNFLDNYNNSEKVSRLELPDGGCLDHSFDEMSAEQILAELRRRKPPEPPQPDLPTPPEGDKPQGDGEGKGDGEPQPGDAPDSKGKGKPDDPNAPRTKEQGGWGEFEDQAAGDDMTPDEMNSEWERRVIQAATAAKMQGKVPDCIEALISDMVNAKVPWQQVLNRFVEETSYNDYSWNNPDRRFLPDDIVLPDLHDETLGEIVVAVDTSGSIYGVPEVVGSFQNEINSLIDRCKPSKLHVVQCDARITDVKEYTDGQPIELTLRGGGGTDFRPVGEYINQHGINPRVCIYLTDLEGSFPEVPWPFPTLWCVYNNENLAAPFGDTIHIPKEG
jgi:predicted metal-dependent peptidase